MGYHSVVAGRIGPATSLQITKCNYLRCFTNKIIIGATVTIQELDE